MKLITALINPLFEPECSIKKKEPAKSIKEKTRKNPLKAIPKENTKGINAPKYPPKDKGSLNAEFIKEPFTLKGVFPNSIFTKC